MRRVAVLAALLVFLAILAAAAGLGWAHWSLRRARPLLPEIAELVSPPAASDLPVAVGYINTASQPMPRRAVLDRARDPNPEAPYVMSHAVFVLRWLDGRLLLIDAGMTPAAAREFGRPLQWLAGAEPIMAHASVAERLGSERARLGGVLFTHLHTDHVQGIDELCRDRHEPLPVWMTRTQWSQTNYTTRPGRALIDAAACTRVAVLDPQGHGAIPGFPGVSVFAAGGHTPDTQVIVARVAVTPEPRLYVFAGDIANHIDGIAHDVSKPFLYRLLLVPEDEGRLAEVRSMLRRLHEDYGATILLAHDRFALEASGIEVFDPRHYLEGSSRRKFAGR